MVKGVASLVSCMALLAALGACRDVTFIVGRLPVAKPDAGGARSDPGPAVPAGALPPAAGTAPGAPRATDPALPATARPRPSAFVIETGTRDQFCAGHGSALRDLEQCVPVERQLFTHAVCTCGDLRLEGDSYLLDGFDSRQSVYVAGQGGAAIGVNGALRASAREARLGGSVSVLGPSTLTGEAFSVRGDLHANARFQTTTSGVQIVRDAWFGADLDAPGPASVRVGRDAYIRPGLAGAEALGGRAQTFDLDLPPPCACDPAQRLDVPAIVAQASALADNAAADFSRDAFKQLIDTNLIVIPCGRLVLSEITIPAGTLAILVMGRASIFVEGDMNIFGTVGITTVVGSELDLFVAGDVNLQGTITFGNGIQPRSQRMYVGGQVTVPESFQLYGALYAPNATQVTAPKEASGALFVGSLTTSGSAQLHYDRALADGTATCASTKGACESCDDCPDSQACVAGSCTACGKDADCCAPLGCDSGRCVPLDLR